MYTQHLSHFLSPTISATFGRSGNTGRCTTTYILSLCVFTNIYDKSVITKCRGQSDQYNNVHTAFLVIFEVLPFRQFSANPEKLVVTQQQHIFFPCVKLLVQMTTIKAS